MVAKLKLAEIARRTGLSIGTVSRVLAGKSNTSAHAKQLVLECARSEGVLQQISGSRMLFNHVLVCAPSRAYDARADVFYHQMIKGLRDEFREQDARLSFCPLEEDHSDAQLFLKCLSDPAVDAVIIVGNDDPKIHELACDLGKPAVLLNCLDREGRLDGVVPDHRQIGEVTAASLLSQGHRDILGMICLRRFTLVDRLQGIRDAFAARNMDYDEGNWLIETSGFSAEEAEHAMDLFLESRRREDYPSAVIASGDFMAAGIAQAFMRRNLRIPEDVSLVSIDGMNPSYTEGFTLNYCRVPCLELGAEALSLLQRRVAHPDAPVCNVRVCGGLVPGNSVQRFVASKARPAVVTHHRGLFYGD